MVRHTETNTHTTTEGCTLDKLMSAIHATSLSVGLGRNYGFTNGNGSTPTICMNFPPLWADAIAIGLLEPFAKPEDCFVGMRQNEDCFEFGAYCVVEVPVPSAFRLEGYDIPDHGTFIIGTDADIPMDGIVPFIEGRQHARRHEFILTVGIEDPRPDFTPTLADRWKVTLDAMLGDGLHERICRRLGIPPMSLL